MKTTLTVLILILSLSFFSFRSNQGKISKYHAVDAIEKSANAANPPSGRTGAPGESNCTVSCHIGTTQSAAGIIDVTFSGAGNEYVVGQNYTITISIASGAKNGFQATILDATDTKAGTFTSGTNYSISNSLGRQYARHNVSDGITSWTVNWTAPANDAGDLTLYYAFNKSNNNDNSSGDIIYLGQLNLASALFNTVTEYEKTDEVISIWFDPIARSLNFDFTVFKTSQVVLGIQNISGQLVMQQNLGVYDPGVYQQNLVPSESPKPGIYIVSLFIDNNVYNRKIYLN